MKIKNGANTALDMLAGSSSIPLSASIDLLLAPGHGARFSPGLCFPSYSHSILYRKTLKAHLLLCLRSEKTKCGSNFKAILKHHCSRIAFPIKSVITHICADADS